MKMEEYDITKMGLTDEQLATLQAAMARPVGDQLYRHRADKKLNPWPFGLLQKGRYSVILADCPWQFESYSGGGVPQRAAAQHYQTLSLDRLELLPVAKLAAPDCALFMWGISSHLPQVLELMDAWGFNFSGKAFAWAKTTKNELDKSIDRCQRGEHWGTAELDHWHMGQGYVTRRNTEDCWLATRGAPKVLDHGVRELLVSPVREHSRKPAEQYERIERLFAGPYCELFGRAERPGWASWGDQVGKFSES